MTVTAADIANTCEVPIRYEARPDGFGSYAIPCGQSVGLHRWIDVSGREHRACWQHVEARMRRYPEPVDGMDLAKAEAER